MARIPGLHPGLYSVDLSGQSTPDTSQRRGRRWLRRIPGVTKGWELPARWAELPALPSTSEVRPGQEAALLDGLLQCP